MKKKSLKIFCLQIDSQWSTGDNNFVWNSKYPDPVSMVKHFHSLGVRVILWATSMIDTDSANFDEAVKKDYLVKGPAGEFLLKWWHGHGGLLDYTNDEAVAWWHAQLDNVLDIGVDGFKVDGTDPYIMELVVPHGKKGVITYREYADLYYRDFFYHSRAKNPDALIMSRPVDADWVFSPRDVVFAGWTGDADPDWVGLKQVVTDFLRSGWRGFVSFGTDIGGYRHGPGPNGRATDLFVRWYQFGAFSPLMENGGNGNHGPWSFDSPGSTTIVDNYRMFTATHVELTPYLLSAGTKAWLTNTSIVRPMAPPSILPVPPKRFDYLLGPDIYVSPFITNATTIEVEFPAGAATWADWWNPATVYKGGSKHNLTYPLLSFPVFRKVGSIIALNVENSYAGHGDESHAGHLTALITGLAPSASAEVHEWKGPGRTIAYTYIDGVLELQASAHPMPLIVVLTGISPEAIVSPEAQVQRAPTGPETVPIQPTKEQAFVIKAGDCTQGLVMRFKVTD